jgi:hypothetical protein
MLTALDLGGEHLENAVAELVVADLDVMPVREPVAPHTEAVARVAPRHCIPPAQIVTSRAMDDERTLSRLNSMVSGDPSPALPAVLNNPVPAVKPLPPACMLTQEVINAIEASVKLQFTLIVTDRGFKVNKYADQYRILSVQKFLHSKSLSDAHILFWIHPERMEEAQNHCKDLQGFAAERRTSHFLVRDGSCTNLHGIKIPREVCMFKQGVRLWKCTDPVTGEDKLLPPTVNTYRVFTEEPKQRCLLSARTSSEVLTMRAGINQASIVMLLDTGASANFMSSTLAKALDLPVTPDTQGLRVTMADGKSASITGTVITTVCMGRYRAKIEFLVTDLNAHFDAVLGYTWLRRNCDLHLSKGILAFRNGSKVSCVRLPAKSNSTEPSGRWQTELPAGTARSTSGAPKQKGTAKGHRSHTEMSQCGRGPLLSANQLAKLVRKGGQAYLLYLQGKAEQLNTMVNSTETVDAWVEQLLEEFKDVFQDPPGLPPVRNVAHVAPLIPGSRPPYRRNYRMTELERGELKKQLAELLRKGLIRPSVSPFGSPVIFVRKPNGELRLCIDYRAVNKLTVRNRYPLPLVDELLDRLKGATCFSCLDLAAGYNQIRIREEDICKTAITTPFGHWEYLVLPMGLANAPSVFSALMNDVFKGMEHYVLVYIDDVMVMSKSPEEHAVHLKAVLARLREHELYAKRSKCHFAKSTLKFLGHVISAGGVQVDPGKIKVLQDWPVPKSVTDVRQFVGLANYFRKFVLGLSELARPLTNLTKNEMAWQWGEAEQTAFDSIKLALCEAPTLRMPDTQKEFTVVCDASNFGIGAVLMQQEHPVAYFSKLLDSAQRNYTVTERELLAVVEALKHWRCYLGDKPFTVVTDHSPLTHFATKVDLHGRQARWAEVLARFSFTWEYRPGRLNVADPLSRNPLHRDLLLTALGISSPKAAVRQMQVTTRSRAAKAKATPAGVGATEKSLSSRQAPGEPPATKVPQHGGTSGTATNDSAQAGQATHVDRTPLEADIIKAYAFDPYFKDTKRTHNWTHQHGFWVDKLGRILVPDHADVRERVMKAHHANPFSGHQGRIRTLDLIHRNYHWGGIAGDVKTYVGQCHECQINKPVTSKPSGLLLPLQIPDRPWSSISVDFVTGFPPVGVNKWDTITVFVDRLTKMVHYVPCREKMSAADFALVFMENVFRLHGLPLQIISDRDPRFTSIFWQEVIKALGMESGFSTAFHPHTDGQTERMNRTMEEMLRHFITPMKGDWTRALPMLEFAYNNAKHTGTQSSPFKMYTGLNPLHPASGPADRNYRVPAAEIFVQEMSDELARAKQCLADAQSKMKITADRKRADVHFKVGEKVLLSTKNLKLKGDMPRKMWPRYIGPYKILAVIRGLAYKLELPQGMKMHNVFHVSLLHKYQQGPNRLSPPPVHIVDGELEYTVEAILAHKVVSGGASKNGRNRNKVMFLTAWEGYGREHDSWEPGDMLQDTEALELYLQAVVRKGEVLPPGYQPEGTHAAPATNNKRAREPSSSRRPLGTLARVAVQQPPGADEQEPNSPPPAAALAPYKRPKRVAFQLGS